MIDEDRQDDRMAQANGSRIQVLMHPVIDERASPYLIHLGAALDRAGIDIVRLRAKALLPKHEAIVHIHWPEHVVRGTGSHLKLLAKQAEALAITAMLLASGKKRVVWTVHNLEPHDGWQGPIERSLFSVMRRRLGGIVTLVPGHEAALREQYPDLGDVPVAVAEPGSTREPGSDAVAAPTEGPTRAVMVGAITPYKKQLEMLRWLKPAMERGEVVLSLVGAVGDADYLAKIRDLAPPVGLEVHDGWVSGSQLDDLVRQNHLVLAPQAGAFNTGVPYVVLPAGVPVAMSPSLQAGHYVETQGSDWVRILPATDDEAGLHALLAWARADRPEIAPGPWSWDAASQAHRALYEAIEHTE